jgi:hypothetical protein
MIGMSAAAYTEFMTANKDNALPPSVTLELQKLLK